MGSNDEHFRVHAFRKARRDREHDAVSKRNDRFSHRKLFIMTFWQITSAFEQVGFEELPHKIQRDRSMRNSELFRMPFGKGKFSIIVLRSIIKTERRCHVQHAGSLVESCNGIHPTAKQHNRPIDSAAHGHAGGWSQR